jgi:hypothetical protein
MKFNFIRKGLFPCSQGGGHAIEDLGVSFIPYTLSCYHEHFHEERQLQYRLPHSIIWKMLPCTFQTKPRQNQRETLDEQSKKRCISVSSTSSRHSTQLYPSSKCLCRRRSMFLVFNLSLSSNQAKNLIFGTHFDFQIHWRGRSGVSVLKCCFGCLFSYLYKLF